MSDALSNVVLARLPKEARDEIVPSLRREELKPWQPLREEGARVERVYFPVDAVISIVNLMEDGRIAEAYTAGRDGIAGGGELIWGGEGTIFRTMCQVPGVVYSFDGARLNEMAGRDPRVMRVLLEYTHCIVAFTGRSAACNMLHQLVERCARWLLVTHDRVRSDTFVLTHDILSTMLGVHRPAVSVAAGTLQRAGLIRYARGKMTIVDRAGLEAASCECYRVVAEEFVRVLGGPQPNAPAG